MSKIARVCGKCWSADVRYMGDLSWDVNKQEYRVENIHDSMYCGACDIESCDTTLPVDGLNNIVYPSVGDVCIGAEYESSHMMARAKIVAANEHIRHEDITRLFEAIVNEGDTEAMIEFLVEFDHCDHTLVEEAILEEKHVGTMRQYLREIRWGNSGRIVDSLIDMALDIKNPSYIEPLICGPESLRYVLNDDQRARVTAVYRMIGGTGRIIYHNNGAAKPGDVE